MATVAWPSLVPRHVSQQSAAWNMPQNLIADDTRGGKQKRRRAHIQKQKAFNVTLTMSLEEYYIFDDWYHNLLLDGVNNFQFPKIDVKNGPLIDYRMVSGTEPQVNNPYADTVEVSMQWEELSYITSADNVIDGNADWYADTIDGGVWGGLD